MKCEKNVIKNMNFQTKILKLLVSVPKNIKQTSFEENGGKLKWPDASSPK